MTVAGPAGDPAPSAAVLAGGTSSRMGRDKAVVEVGGQALVSRVVAAARRAGASPVAIIGHRTPQHLPADLEATVVADLHPGQGPVGGLLTALAWSPAPVVLVLACDLPDLDPGDLVRLAQAPDTTHPVAVLVGPRGPEPLVGAWHSRARDTVAGAFAAGIRAVHEVLDLFPPAHVPVTDPASLRNVNRPADLTPDRRPPNPSPSVGGTTG